MAVIANTAARLYGLFAGHLPFHREPLRSFYNVAYLTYKRFEDPFANLAAARPDLFEGGHIVDAGANVGYTTLLFARHVSEPFQVHAFEPDPGSLSLLARNAAKSPYRSRIRIHSAAVGSRNRRAKLAINRSHPADHRIITPSFVRDEVIEVDVVAIDDAVDGPVAFVKMDVQGYELEASRGMQMTMERNSRIAVALEYAPRAMTDLGFDPWALLMFYRDRGFHFQRIDRRNLIALEPMEIARRIRGDNFVNLLCTRR